MMQFIAIGLVVFLVFLFIFLFLMNKKTPKPEGCESIEINDENCSACNNAMCDLKTKIDFKKIEEEIKEEK